MNDSTKYGWNQEMPLSLLEKVRQDLKTAMLAKDQEARNAAVKQAETHSESPDA